MEKRVSVIFKGHVQGVGFRYTVVHYARSYRITGFVRNCSDGTVELVAEGEEGELEAFLAKIMNGQLGAHIHETKKTIEPAHGTYGKFSIAY